jgi:NADH:ubiquinone oxidoreductase subunit 5 (subunit L)/multisubunit Na+/H+ antiporter MnhA subunit
MGSGEMIKTILTILKIISVLLIIGIPLLIYFFLKDQLPDAQKHLAFNILMTTYMIDFLIIILVVVRAFKLGWRIGYDDCRNAVVQNYQNLSEILREERKTESRKSDNRNRPV